MGESEVQEKVRGSVGTLKKLLLVSLSLGESEVKEQTQGSAGTQKK
jgi:hypothetical protein